MQTEYFECSCHSPEHTLSLAFDDDEDLPAIYGHVFLGENPWYKRVWMAVKYVFGYKCKYGHFDEFVFNPEDCDRMIGLFKKLKATQKGGTKRK